MQKKKFKTESQKLLDMMINSIYTHKEIFLRELISNASDAIDKLYYRSLTDDSVKLKREDYAIRIEADKEGRNLILYGNPGTGKTHLATALGIAACNAGYSVLFTSVPRLLTQIRECRNAMTLRALENKFERYDMVICDEFGYVSCDKAGAEMLFNHLSLRTDKKTTVITTNLAFNRWDEIIADKVLVTAMVDRLTHKAILLNMTGKSYRMKETQDMINKQI